MGLSQAEKWIPGARWLRGYTAQFFISDLIAGITVGLTVLPQGLAYSTLAGLEPQYGLYSAFVGGVVYALLGGCREVTIGPTALLALMTSRHTGLGEYNVNNFNSFNNLFIPFRWHFGATFSYSPLLSFGNSWIYYGITKTWCSRWSYLSSGHNRIYFSHGADHWRVTTKGSILIFF